MGDIQALRFGDLGELFDGPHATPRRIDEGPYFLNISSLQAGRLNLEVSDHVSEDDFVRWTRRVTPRADDLLFSYETRLGEAALMPGGVEACLGRRMALLRPDLNVVNPRFLLYYYLSPQFQALIDTHTIPGATVHRIGLATMPDWPVDIPDLVEQERIADVLGALDDKIAANERVSSLVAGYLRAEFTSMDVMLPEGCLGTAQLSDVVELNPRTQLVASTDAAPFLEMKNLPDSAMTVSEWGERIPKGGARFVDGDTLVARITPCLENGKTGLVDFLGEGVVGTGSTEYIVMRPKSGVPAAFAYCIAVDEDFRAFAIRHMIGTSGRQRVAAADLAHFQINLPGASQLDQFGAMSAPLLRRLKGAVDESRVLGRTRDELLPLLMSGKLTVKDCERRVSDVL